jgi:hypothetical protein
VPDEYFSPIATNYSIESNTPHSTRQIKRKAAGVNTPINIKKRRTDIVELNRRIFFDNEPVSTDKLDQPAVNLDKKYCRCGSTEHQRSTHRKCILNILNIHKLTKEQIASINIAHNNRLALKFQVKKRSQSSQNITKYFNIGIKVNTFNLININEYFVHIKYFYRMIFNPKMSSVKMFKVTQTNHILRGI